MGDIVIVAETGSLTTLESCSGGKITVILAVINFFFGKGNSKKFVK